MPFSPLILAVALATASLAPQPAVQNPFRKQAGKLPAASCPETPITSGGIPRKREYLEAVVKCLDRSWGAYFGRAGLRFAKPAAEYHEEPEGSVCGVRLADVDAFYCHRDRTLVFPLTGRWIDNRTDLYPFKVAAHEYAHHLQTLTGTRRSYEEAYRAAPARRRAEVQRRFELQADCLAGVFMGSVRGSLTRTEDDWAQLWEAVRAGGDSGERRSHGKGANRAYWLKRGHSTLDPSACDTFSAPASRVA